MYFFNIQKQVKFTQETDICVILSAIYEQETERRNKLASENINKFLIFNW